MSWERNKSRESDCQSAETRVSPHLFVLRLLLSVSFSHAVFSLLHWCVIRVLLCLLYLFIQYREADAAKDEFRFLHQRYTAEINTEMLNDTIIYHILRIEENGILLYTVNENITIHLNRLE